MHQGCHTWKVKSFLNLANKAQISSLGQRGIHTNMTMLTSFVLEWTQLPLASPLEYLVVVLCPLLEPIVWFQSSPTMVAKSIKVLVDMVCGILNVVPLDPTFNAMFYKRTLTMNVSWKSYLWKLLVFLFHVMTVGKITPEVVFENHTKSIFVMMIWITMWEVMKKNMWWIIPLCP